MPHALPERIWPLRLARRGERLDGRFADPDLPRLRAAVTDIAGDVEVSLTFSTEGDFGTARGSIRATLILCCQRCLGPMPWQADIDVATRFATGDTAEDQTELETVRLDEDGGTMLRDLVEDEVLLAMPQIPRHDERDCPVKLQPAPPPVDEPRKNPFAVLAGLKASD